MFKRLCFTTPFTLFGTRVSPLDEDKLNRNDNAAGIIITNEQTEGGWNGIKRMFHIDEFGNISNELVSVMQLGTTGMFIGAIYGGFMESKDAYRNFIHRNQATSFESHIEAKRKLQETIYNSFGRGALKWCLRISIFSTSFLLIANVCSAYRGKNGIIEYGLGGAVSGALVKTMLGPYGMLSGAFFGGVLGLVGGASIFVLTKVSGLSVDEIRFWQTHYYHKRQELIGKSIRQQLDEQDSPLLAQHDKAIGRDALDLRAVVP